MEKRYHILLNASAGAAGSLGLDKASLEAAFSRAGLSATTDDRQDVALSERIGDALGSDAPVIVSAGGDGTATALASALVDSDKTLAVLPLGTANLLARDLGIPLDLKQAIDTLAAMQPRRIDVGAMNGRIFLHKVVIGLVPGIAADRERIRGQEGLRPTMSFLRQFLQRLSRARPFEIDIDRVSGERRTERVQSIAIANNAYDEGVGRFFAKQSLDGGHLSVYVLKQLKLADMLRLSAGMLIGRWRQDEALAIDHLKAVTIRSRKRRVSVMIDGEVERLATPLLFEIRPKALAVLAPVAAGIETETAEVLAREA